MPANTCCRLHHGYEARDIVCDTKSIHIHVNSGKYHLKTVNIKIFWTSNEASEAF